VGVSVRRGGREERVLQRMMRREEEGFCKGSREG